MFHRKVTYVHDLLPHPNNLTELSPVLNVHNEHGQPTLRVNERGRFTLGRQEDMELVSE